MPPLAHRRSLPSAALGYLLFALSSPGPKPATAQEAARPDVEVRCHVFQTARDAPVVPGKRTVIRVYANWKEETGPGDGEEEQLAVAHATVRVRAGQSDLPPLEKWFWRPDWQLRADSVEAEISANHYGWRPPPGDGKTPIPVRAVVEFESPETGKTFGYDAACPVIGLPSAPTLKIDYYFVKVLDWYDEEGEEWEEWGPDNFGTGDPWENLRLSGHRMMEESAAFAVQNLPVGDVDIRYGGSLAFEGPFEPLIQSSGWDVGRALFNAADAANPDADIIVGIVPPSLGDWWGLLVPLGRPFVIPGGDRVVLLDLSMSQDYDVDGHAGEWSQTILAHEIGHFYGLCHTSPPLIPSSAAAAQFPCAWPLDPSSRRHNEGFRLFNNSSYAYNKSDTEGNGERPEEEVRPVTPLMETTPEIDLRRLIGSYEPSRGGAAWQFINNEYYHRLIRTLTWLGVYDRPASGSSQGARLPLSPGPRPGFGNPAHGPSAGPADGVGPVAPTPSRPPSPRSAAERYMVVSGVVPASDGTVHLDPVRVRELRQPPEVEPGDYRLELRGADGELLDAVPFAPLGGRPSHGEWTGEKAFRIGVPAETQIAEIVVRREGTVLARRIRSSSAPALSVVSPVRDEAWDGSVPLRWSGSDPDGDTLVYDVYHSPDGERWAPLAVAVPDTELAWLGAEDLEAGPSPRFRIVALDGFHSTEVEVPYALHGGFRALASTPGPGDTVPPPRTISVRFNREVDAGSLHPRAVELRDGQGTPVSGEVELEPSGRVARFTLSESLREGASYEVVLREGVSDRFGNRLDRALRWSFRTHPDRRRPRLVERHPMPGALALPPETRVVLRFDEPMDPETLGPPALRVEDQATEELVSGSWHRDGEAREVVFTPDDVLTSGATYRVTVAEGVRDEAGNSLQRPPAPWTFRVTGLVRPLEPRSEP